MPAGEARTGREWVRHRPFEWILPLKSKVRVEGTFNKVCVGWLRELLFQFARITHPLLEKYTPFLWGAAPSLPLGL